MFSFKTILVISICFISISTQAQWQKAKGEFACSNVYNYLTIDSIILGGTRTNGIIISKNNGNTWSKNIPVKYPITQLYNFEGILIGFFGHEHTYIICSKDRGDTWEEIPTDILYINNSKFIYSLTIYNHEIQKVGIS